MKSGQMEFRSQMTNWTFYFVVYTNHVILSQQVIKLQKLF
jgi:hypothetical protein